MDFRPFRSVNRPEGGVSQHSLVEHRKLIETVERRGFLRGAVSLGSLALLTGCDVSNDASIQKTLRLISEWNDRVQAFLFSPTRLAPTYSEAEVLNPPRFNAFYLKSQVKPVDIKSWKLELAGLVETRKSWTLDELNALPQVSQITRHVCVEGWDYIGKWSGIAFAEFLKRIGADTKAKYVTFKCYDGYSGTIDMASAMHPQTQLTLRYADQVLPDAYGFPVRIRIPTKLGYKTPKWITAIEVTNTYRGGYWEDRGYNFFGGI
ncbi:MAG TPA: molybdopterin-dependent oxidoreductase [Stellaceae bacterium]|nr:molybdopterin-dependent oxidoreductase [Stellaceae bacterium]